MAKNQPKAGSAGTNTTATDTSESLAVVSEPGAAPAAPESDAATKTEDATLTTEAGESPPSGGEVRARFNPEELAGDPLAAGDFEVTHLGNDFEVTHIHVRAVSDGFRRAGRAWPAGGVEVPVADFSLQQIDALWHEPQLVVTPVADPAAE